MDRSDGDLTVALLGLSLLVLWLLFFWGTRGLEWAFSNQVITLSGLNLRDLPIFRLGMPRAMRLYTCPREQERNCVSC